MTRAIGYHVSRTIGTKLDTGFILRRWKAGPPADNGGQAEGCPCSAHAVDALLFFV